MLDLTIIGLSLAANGLLWFLIGSTNRRRARARTIGPRGSNFERVHLEGEAAVVLGRKRRGWGLAGVIVGLLTALAGLAFGPLELDPPSGSPPVILKKERGAVVPLQRGLVEDVLAAERETIH